MKNNRIVEYEIVSNVKIANQVYEMILKGDGSWVEKPGQFLNIQIEGKYLRRPISICDYEKNQLTIIYKVVGDGTSWLSKQNVGQKINALIGLGNGFDIGNEEEVVVVGGGVGVPPMYGLCKELIKKNKRVYVYLGFQDVEDIFYEQKFKDLGCAVFITTDKASTYPQGFVSKYIKEHQHDTLPYYVCGPHGLLMACLDVFKSIGQLSFEERMGCGFGACMGCSCKTLTGYKRICVEGPVLSSEEIIR